MNALSPLAQQASKPEGALGVAVADIMDAINKNVQQRVISLLVGPRVHARDMVEIGFGGGALQAELDATGTLNTYVGVEVSETLVREFNKAHRDPRGGARAVMASVELMPLRSGIFDTCVALNTIYWWRDPVAGLKEIRRVLKPAGSLVIGMATRGPAAPLDADKPGGPKHYSPAEIGSFLANAGFYVRDCDEFVDQVYLGDIRQERPYMLLLAEAL